MPKKGRSSCGSTTSSKCLGLVNPESCKDRTVSIGHTEERRAELVAKVNDILAEGWLGAKEAERLRGRVSFFESYAFGRLAKWVCLKIVYP